MKNIYLCGFMGSGKTYAGISAKQKLGIKFIDLDAFIQFDNKMTIPNIFKNFGVDYFRELEYKSLIKTADYYSLISLGGGALTFDKSRDFIKENGTLIFINTDFETCYKRIKSDANRPIAAASNKQELKNLYASRMEHYNAADYITKDADSTVLLIEKILNRKN